MRPLSGTYCRPEEAACVRRTALLPPARPLHSSPTPPRPAPRTPARVCFGRLRIHLYCSTRRLAAPCCEHCELRVSAVIRFHPLYLYFRNAEWVCFTLGAANANFCSAPFLHGTAELMGSLLFMAIRLLIPDVQSRGDAMNARRVETVGGAASKAVCTPCCNPMTPHR